jgi:hypothetical protein
MSDLSELNKQLSSLSQDFETQQQWNEVRQKQINDEKYNKMNNKWQEYQTFNTTQNTPYPQPQHPTHNPKLPNNYQQYPQQQTIQNNFTYQHYQSNQSHQPQSQFTRMDNYQVLHQPELHQNQQTQYQQQYQEQQQEQHPQQDLRQDMNSRMDKFRFDTESNMKHTLVPVDMNHYYSGNLFMEGSPVPNGLPENVEQYSNNTGLKNQSRLLHQEKSKTLYRNDVNERMAQFSPLGRTLHFPVNHHSTNNNSQVNTNNNAFPQNILTKTSRKNEMKADINARLSGYTPLSSNTPLQDINNYSRNEIAPYPTHSGNANQQSNNQLANNQQYNNTNNHQNNNINRQQKIKFQEMMPVSST